MFNLLPCPLPQENFITPAVFGEIIYENFLFDIPKILDLCVLFGKGNSQLLHKMIGEVQFKSLWCIWWRMYPLVVVFIWLSLSVNFRNVVFLLENIFTQQPSYYSDLDETVPTVLQVRSDVENTAVYLDEVCRCRKVWRHTNNTPLRVSCKYYYVR